MYNSAARSAYYTLMFFFGLVALAIFLPAFACGGCFMGLRYGPQHQGCDKGDAARCMELGKLYESSGYYDSIEYTIFGSDDHAALAYQRACNLGSLEGCSKFGWQVATYELTSHEADAVKSLGKACDAKDNDSCYLLGFMFGNGRGTARDPARAAALCAQSCDAGARNACYVLASFYARGLGVPGDKQKEIELLKRSCGDGYQPACECENDGHCDWERAALRYISSP